jgi:FlaA1/EpsC-like NDP-sugar epimerase
VNIRHYRQTSAQTLILLAIDGIIIFSSVYYGVAIRYSLGVPHEYAEVLPLLPRAVAFTSILLVTFASLGIYARESARGNIQHILRMALGFVIGAVLMFLAGHVVQRLFLGRMSIVLATALACLLMIGARIIVHRFLFDRRTASHTG